MPVNNTRSRSTAGQQIQSCNVHQRIIRPFVVRPVNYDFFNFERVIVEPVQVDDSLRILRI